MKRCPTCQKTFDDSMKFCQIDGTPLTDASEMDAGGNSPALIDEADFIQTQIISREEMEKEFGAGEMKSGTADDVSPPSPFGSSSSPWMDSQSKSSGDFSPNSSPFDENESSSYRSPASPFKEPEPMFGRPEETFNQSSFGNQSESYDSPRKQSEWTPPPAPVAEWQNQNLGLNTPFQPPMSGQGEDKTLAIVSLVSGILSVTCCWGVAGVVALITGYMAKNNADGNPQQYGGRGMALAGMILGGVSIFLAAIWFIFAIIGGALR